MKAKRNRTIDISVAEGQEYLERCLKWPSVQEILERQEILDRPETLAQSETSKLQETLDKTETLAQQKTLAPQKTLDSLESLELQETLDLHGAPEQIAPANFVDTIIWGDTFDVLPHLPLNSIDLAIIDPPYNLDKEFHDYKFHQVTPEQYAEYTESWLKLVMPHLKENASVYVCCDWGCSSQIYDVLRRYLTVQNRITWQREKGRGALRNWKNGMEDIWFATRSNDYTFNVDAVKMRRRVIAPYKVDGRPKDWEETDEGNFRNTYPSNFWDDISIPYWSMPENTAHPTQKAEKLLAKLILASSNPGDLVFDPFAGSGSTAVTAYKLNRHYIGIEQNPQYCVWAQKRLEMATTDKTIQGYTEGIFWERNAGRFMAQEKRTSEKKKPSREPSEPGHRDRQKETRTTV